MRVQNSLVRSVQRPVPTAWGFILVEDTMKHTQLFETHIALCHIELMATPFPDPILTDQTHSASIAYPSSPRKVVEDLFVQQNVNGGFVAVLKWCRAPSPRKNATRAVRVIE